MVCTEFEEFECEVHKMNTRLQSVADDFEVIDVIDIVQGVNQLVRVIYIVCIY